MGKERMSVMLSSDATFSMEMFLFGHCPEENDDVSSVCFVSENNNNNNNNNKEERYTRENNNNNNNNKKEERYTRDRRGYIDETNPEVLHGSGHWGGSGNSGGKRLVISMVEEAWLSKKKDV
nr:hypothetical protein [Tanacetum cinerariifolium]